MPKRSGWTRAAGPHPAARTVRLEKEPCLSGRAPFAPKAAHLLLVRLLILLLLILLLGTLTSAHGATSFLVSCVQPYFCRIFPILYLSGKKRTSGPRWEIMNKKPETLENQGSLVVRREGFEPPAFWSVAATRKFIRCFPALLWSFRSRPQSCLGLFTPLLPQGNFLVWVRIWVKTYANAPVKCRKPIIPILPRYPAQAITVSSLQKIPVPLCSCFLS